MAEDDMRMRSDAAARRRRRVMSRGPLQRSSGECGEQVFNLEF